ncbi:unnamed protein product [Pleuronectes platessa]|uniref:Uncharacterized protein n=1 Tax=Pleuronectes platessa TaxID=8262 RepID=A0A9N7U929_PLEPL|nr:unnamed protein product [Pleuronectes platessa]
MNANKAISKDDHVPEAPPAFPLRDSGGNLVHICPARGSMLERLELELRRKEASSDQKKLFWRKSESAAASEEGCRFQHVSVTQPVLIESPGSRRESFTSWSSGNQPH